jgi:hypothetical protein
MGIPPLMARSDIGARSIRLSTDRSDRWQFDGQVSPKLDGCLELDLGSPTSTRLCRCTGWCCTTRAVHRAVPATTEAMPQPQTQSTLETHAFAADR